MRLVVAVVLVIAILLGVAAQGAKAPKAPVDLNHGTVAELMTLPGVGESKAQAIVRHRALHPFTRTSELLRVKGIGRNLFARLRPFVTLGPASGVTGTAAPASLSPSVWPGAAGVVGRPAASLDPAVPPGASVAAKAAIGRSR
jgi:competence protein ComEA